MLRVGLTGGLGSGKSTAAQRFAELGAHVLSSDEIGRELMQPGQPVYSRIVERFGPAVVHPDGSLNRAALAHMAFSEGRLDELTAIVHPATIERQAQLAASIASRDPNAVIIVESALIFETKYDGADGWRRRFDKIILVTAPEETRIARFVSRMAGGSPINQERKRALEAEARRRMSNQLDDVWKAAHSDFVLTNDKALSDLYTQVDALWPQLQQQASTSGS